MLARRTGRTIAKAPRLPVAGAYIWAAFCDLDATRPVGMSVGAIPYVEMAAYAVVHGFRWEPVEIAAIRAIDRAFLIHQSDQVKKRKEPTNGRLRTPGVRDPNRGPRAR